MKARHLKVVPEHGTTDEAIEQQMVKARGLWAALGSMMLQVENASPRTAFAQCRVMEVAAGDLGDLYASLALLHEQRENE